MRVKAVIAFLIGIAFSAPVFALQCVEYVRQQSGWTDFPQTPPNHEAYRWWETARNNGYALGNKPMVGSVLVWKGWSKKDANGKEIGNPAGHVVITASVVSDTEITVNHANWPADGKIRLGIKVSDVSGGNWTKVRVNDGATEYDVYGFIYPKAVSLGPSIRLCAQISGTRTVCWDTKNSVDKRCESGSDWTILDNQTKWRYPATKAICSSTGCYRSTSVLDFFMRPAYAAAIDGCAFQETGTGYGGSGPYPTPADPEEYGSPSSSDLPKLVTAGTSSSAPNLEASVDIEKDKEPDSNAYVRVGDLYCGVKAKNTTSASIGSFKNKCILYDGRKAGNDPPVTLDSKTVDGLGGGDKETTHHAFTIRDPGYYTLYGCVNTGSSPPKEKSISDNCDTKTFQAYSIPDVYVQRLSLQGGTEFLPGSTVTIVADFGNTGDDFHAGKNRRMTVTAELSGCVSSRMMDTTDIDEDVLRHGDDDRTKLFSFVLPLAATGICTVTVVADPEGELLQTSNKEENRGNNRKSITFQVVEPTPPVPQVPVISVTKVTFINGSHVYTTEEKDISIEVKNSGNAASLPMTGSMFYTPIAGGQDTSIGTFSIEAIPAGGTTTGIIPDVLFSGSGEMTTTVCFDSIPKCWDGGNVYVDTVQSPPGGEDEDGSTIMRLYRGMMQ